MNELTPPRTPPQIPDGNSHRRTISSDYDSEDEDEVQFMGEYQRIPGSSRSRQSKCGSEEDVEELTDSSPYSTASEEPEVERPNQRNESESESFSDRDDDTMSTTATRSDRMTAAEPSAHCSHTDPPIAIALLDVDVTSTTTPKEKKKRIMKNQKSPRNPKRARNSNEELAEDEDHGSENIEDSSTDNQSSSHGQDEDPVNSEGVPPVSIHKINLTKFLSEENEDQAMTEEKIIRKLVARYNKATVNTQKDAGYVQEKVKPDLVPKVKSEDEKFFVGDQFKVFIFIHEAIKEIPILKRFGINKGSSTLHSIIFYYRPSEIFALTTGMAFHVVLSHSDYNFPLQIAARLLEKGKMNATTKDLIGNEKSTKKCWKKSQEENPFDSLSICTTFVAKMRDDASIFRLSCFRQAKDSAAAATETKVQICFTSVRIFRRFKVEDFQSILSHFSLISNGAKTVVFGGKGNEGVVELGTNDHRLIQIPNSVKLHNELELTLADKIFDYFSVQGHTNSVIRDAEAAVENFGLCPKNMDDFAQATSFRLTYKNLLNATFKLQPSFQEILNLLYQTQEIRDQSADGGNKGDKFFATLNNVKLEFTCRGGVVYKSTKIFDYLEGIVWREDGVFWKVMSTWCLVSDQSSYITHSQVIEHLKERLTTEVPLSLPWRSRGDLKDEAKKDESFNPEKFYVNLYRGKRRSWVPRDTEQENKLFDMIRWAKEDGKLFIYFVVSGFDGKIGSKARMISKAAAAIKTACLPSSASASASTSNTGKTRKTDDINPWLEKFYESRTSTSTSSRRQRQRRRFNKVFPSMTEFLKKLREGTIMLAIGSGRGGGSGGNGRKPSLLKESRLENTLTEEGIIKILDEETDRNDKNARLRSMSRTFGISLPGNGIEVEDWMKDLANKIYNRLAKLKYLERSSGSVTSKLLVATNFQFGSNVVESSLSDADELFIFNEFIVRRQSFFKTFLAKMGLHQINEELSKTGWKMWNICEIPQETEDERTRRLARSGSDSGIC